MLIGKRRNASSSVSAIEKTQKMLAEHREKKLKKAKDVDRRKREEKKRKLPSALNVKNAWWDHLVLFRPCCDHTQPKNNGISAFHCLLAWAMIVVNEICSMGNVVHSLLPNATSHFISHFISKPLMQGCCPMKMQNCMKTQPWSMPILFAKDCNEQRDEQMWRSSDQSNFFILFVFLPDHILDSIKILIALQPHV
jgi:hypothetical protein